MAMRSQCFVLFALFLVSLNSAFADSSRPNPNLSKLKYLLKHRTGFAWKCRKGNKTNAVVLFKVDDVASSRLSGRDALAILDRQICNAVGVTCPFVSGAYEPTFRRDLGDRKYRYWSTNGKYADTVVFVSDGDGMKLAGVDNGSQPAIHWDRNWYFGAGECVRY
jgi:hypothetical protein